MFIYVKNNIDDVQEDLVLMFAGEKIPSGIEEYAATAQQLDTKEEIYSAMVVYGLLTYDNGCVFIPNKELQEIFLAVGISYDKITKKHVCKIEELHLKAEEL